MIHSILPFPASNAAQSVLRYTPPQLLVNVELWLILMATTSFPARARPNWFLATLLEIPYGLYAIVPLPGQVHNFLPWFVPRTAKSLSFFPDISTPSLKLSPSYPSDPYASPIHFLAINVSVTPTPLLCNNPIKDAVSALHCFILFEASKFSGWDTKHCVGQMLIHELTWQVSILPFTIYPLGGLGPLATSFLFWNTPTPSLPTLSPIAFFAQNRSAILMTGAIFSGSHYTPKEYCTGFSSRQLSSGRRGWQAVGLSHTAHFCDETSIGPERQSSLRHSSEVRDITKSRVVHGLQCLWRTDTHDPQIGQMSSCTPLLFV